MKYSAPSIKDLGSIAEHTFGEGDTNPNNPAVRMGLGPSSKDHRVCKLDDFGEYSCPS
jgi:hypothetical protein